MASLPGLTVSFLLKDVLKMTATAASYFAAVTLVGWAVKPLWGIISDAVPIFGSRRKSYLVFTAVLASIIWFSLGQTENHTVKLLLVLFTVSSAVYAFMDVVCDGLMVETGKPHNLTGRFQSIQWTSVYVASIITGFAGGWAAQNLKPQTVFSINAVFPIIILFSVLLFIKEDKPLKGREQFRKSLAALKEAFGTRTMWLLAFFLFFVAFSPSFGTPFFYYAVDHLKFDKIFFGIVGSVGAASAALGAILYAKFQSKLNTRRLIKLAIIVGIIATLFDLIYFTPFVTDHLERARIIYILSSAVLGIVGSVTFLVVLNAAALACPKYSEGTTFATLMSFWNIGLIGSGILGGFLFSKIGLQPLIFVSAIFTAAAWFVLPRLRFSDDRS